MVLSKLDTVEYEEKDLFNDTMVMKIHLRNKIKKNEGKIKHFWKTKIVFNKNIVFFPMYLLNESKIICQLGIIEMTNKQFFKNNR